MDSNTEAIQTITENIQSVKDLLGCMSQLNKDQFNSCINAVDLSDCDFEPYSTWSDACYTRNCLYCDERYEVILICWEPGQQTPIHDHGGEECWVKIISGTIKETIYKPDATDTPVAISTNIAEPGHTSYMIDFMGCHRLENDSNQRAMSLHIYAKPIAQCNIYDEESAQYVLKDLSYDCIVEV